MNADALDALRLLAGLIAADIHAGSPILAPRSPSVEGRPRARGRPPSRPFAVVAGARARAS